MRRQEVKDTYIDDSLSVIYSNAKQYYIKRLPCTLISHSSFDLCIHRIQFASAIKKQYRTIIKLRSANRNIQAYPESSSYVIDQRVKNIEQQAEEEYIQRQQRQRVLEEQRGREKQLEQEMQYSAYNYHQMTEQQLRNPKQLYSIQQFVNTPTGSGNNAQNRRIIYQAETSDSFSAHTDPAQIYTPHFKSNTSQTSLNQLQDNENYYLNQDELANDVFKSEVDGLNRNSRVRFHMTNDKRGNTDDMLVNNTKANEYVLNYLNNDDFNFNEKQQKTFVERKIEEQERHTHNNLNGKLSKHCSACQRKKQIEENKQKELMYNGVNLNSLLLDCKDALQKKYFKKSETLLTQVLQKGVDHADVYYLLGETYRLQNDLDEAEKYLLQALLFQFHSPYTYNSLGSVYQAKQQYERAIKLFKKFVETNEEPKVFFNIGVCLVKQKEYLDSIVYFGRAIELDESQPIFYLHRADANEALGFVDMSLKDYRFYKQFSQNGLSNLEEQYTQLMKNGMLLEARNLRNYIKKIQAA